MLAEAMRFVEHGEDGLGRLEAEQRAEARASAGGSESGETFSLM